MRTTTHRIYYSTAGALSSLKDDSVDLVVTSPPYPMIEMWDADFWRSDPTVKTSIETGGGREAFELMHRQLDVVWREVSRVTKTGAIVCVNIGDATRTLDKVFQLYSSHARIVKTFLDLGFQNLPSVIWRKTTNAPNKFMGSGMLPPGAYVTLEHEYILIFRKGNKRVFSTEHEKQLRRESAYFWEERNQWFSDVWFNLQGTLQELNHRGLRERSAAFPFELPYRLINMFSIKGDTVLDPFLGTGTTTFAAAATERNSVGYELDQGFRNYITGQMATIPTRVNKLIVDRLEKHLDFVRQRQNEGKPPKFTIRDTGIPCISRQESGIVLNLLDRVELVNEDEYSAQYRPMKLSYRESEGGMPTLVENTDELGKQQTSLDLN